MKCNEAKIIESFLFGFKFHFSEFVGVEEYQFKTEDPFIKPSVKATARLAIDTSFVL